MAVFTGSFLSVELGRQNSVSVILPHDIMDEPAGGFPVLYLLHGGAEDSRTWLYRSNIERYAMERGICVVMPDAGMSYFTDLPSGERYLTYISRELPQIMNAMFRIPSGREKSFIGGASIGGYGALKCAIARPQQYAGCIALSPIADLNRIIVRECNDGRRQFWKSICGEDMRMESNVDIFHMMEEAGEQLAVSFPRVYFACGKQDEAFDDNLRLREAFNNLRIDFTFEQAGAGHDWDFWDVALQRGLDVIFGKPERA